MQDWCVLAKTRGREVLSDIHMRWMHMIRHTFNEEITINELLWNNKKLSRLYLIPKGLLSFCQTSKSSKIIRCIWHTVQFIFFSNSTAFFAHLFSTFCKRECSNTFITFCVNALRRKHDGDFYDGQIWCEQFVLLYIENVDEFVRAVISRLPGSIWYFFDTIRNILHAFFPRFSDFKREWQRYQSMFQECFVHLKVSNQRFKLT